MTIKEVTDALEWFAPLPLQEGWDNAGLQIGLTDADASGVLLCLDVTEEVIKEAAHKGCNLVVSHHPLLFRGLKQISDQNQVARCVRLAMEQHIAIYSAHTNLDNAPGGVNFEIADRLGAKVEGWLQQQSGVDAGSGVIAVLPASIERDVFLQRVKEVFDIHTLCINACQHTHVSRIGICGGAGDFLLDEAVRRGCDCFLTGEMHYHQYFGREDEILIGVMGHYQSEKFTISLLHRVLNETLPGLRVFETEINTNAIKYI